jgi:alpha-L-fucosidase
MKHFHLFRVGGIFLLCGLFGLLRAVAANASEAEHLEPSATAEPVTAGPFQPSWDSLKQFKTPEWFRDAKFGIWAHWTAQCVPEQGDWYARSMYIQGSHDYEYQVAHYGHPSKFGFKDIDHIWHAEHWDPEKLIALYKKAGAQYFVALANHHDNFDCFDSKYQPWNSVNIGPKKDIVGLWAKAARAAGLKFGVTEHAARTWTWFEVAQGSDKTGPLAGIPYDGTMTPADGKGLWWQGYDPADLYAQNHAIGAPPSQAYCDKFFNRTLDLIAKYKPDLLYFDDNVLPLDHSGEQFGLKIAADLYNSSAKENGGVDQAVMNTKGLNPDQRKCFVWDIERGMANEIEPFAWQTDTCIGAWHYSAAVFEHHGYKTADLVVHMLADIVSQNGNLLLNIPLKGDGTIDSDEETFLKDMAGWMDVNKEAIFSSRPWKIYGEGPSTVEKPSAKSSFNERKRKYTASDVRYTIKGDTLYAIVLGWPEQGTVEMKALGLKSPQAFGKIASIQLLGAADPVKFDQSDDSLKVDFPKEKPCDYAYVLKIARK